jgi:hydrogenase maturation protease
VNAARTLILGLGNTLLQDEALGVRALDLLTANYYLPESVEVLDGGTHGLNLLPYLADMDRVLFLDAVHFDALPGDLIRLEGGEIPARLALKMSMHQTGLQDLLAALYLRGKSPKQMVLWGMQPGVVDWGLECSPAVQSALPLLVERAVNELRGWKIDLENLSG